MFSPCDYDRTLKDIKKLKSTENGGLFLEHFYTVYKPACSTYPVPFLLASYLFYSLTNDPKKIDKRNMCKAKKETTFMLLYTN